MANPSAFAIAMNLPEAREYENIVPFTTETTAPMALVFDDPAEYAATSRTLTIEQEAEDTPVEEPSVEPTELDTPCVLDRETDVPVVLDTDIAYSTAAAVAIDADKAIVWDTTEALPSTADVPVDPPITYPTA